MPPFVPRKRSASDDQPSAKRPALSADDAAPRKVLPAEIPDSDSDSVSSLSDAPSSEDLPKDEKDRDDHNNNNNNNDEDGDSDDDDDGDDEVDWEDAMENTGVAPAAAAAAAAGEAQDLELTLDKNEVHLVDLLEGKKAPTKIEREIRILTHCMHVQCLLFHNAIRNAWISDPKVHEILRNKLPAGIQKEVRRWRVASGLESSREEEKEKEEEEQPEKNEKKGKGRKSKSKRQSQNRDWSNGSSRLEPGQPDMSRGDPIISLLKVLAAYWKRQFKITAPGLRKRGYRPMSVLTAEISSFQKDEHDPEKHGERIRNLDEFRTVAERMEGSRDVGAQLFTALLRALNIEARLVASLQPLGFGWTKAETYQAPSAETKTDDADVEAESEPSESANCDSEPGPSRRNQKGYDHDLPFPIYWTEVASPVTHEIIPVDALVLPNAVATTPELQAAFEPRGAKAERAKQIIAYVVAYSSDGTAKDVTTRYLRRRMWPGKTKGYRMPVEKIPVPGQRGRYYEYDWFKLTMRGYAREEDRRTAVDDIEDTRDLVPSQPEKKQAREGDTLQSLRSSTEFVLERFLRRDEAIRPGAKHVRTFTTGKGNKAKEEKVFRRADVVKVQSAESWHKEGRRIKVGEAPLKLVPIRAVTLLRKREVDELERETGEKPKQGLYARYQTEYIIPPPIQNGVIPKNEYGNIDCFVPSMVPQGAVHIPWRGTVRICKKLGVDYAEAVTGFEFGSKMAVPIIEGVVVAAENEGLVKDAWRAEEAERRRKEQLKQEKRILQTWRKFLMGLRIAERVREEYGVEGDKETHNPFTNRRNISQEERREPSEPPEDQGGGFLLPGEDDEQDDGNLIVERQESAQSAQQRPQSVQEDEEEDEEDKEDESDLSDVEEVWPPSEDEPDHEIRLPPLRRTRGRGK